MPSISITPRAAKCRIDSFSRAGQLVLMQRLAASPSSRTISPPHTGQCLGMRNGRRSRALRHHAHHLRDDVAGALHQHRVADLDAQPRDFVLVVQRGARHRDAADARPAFRWATGVSAPVRPTCTLDVLHHGLFLTRRKFERDGPARRFGGPAELALLAHRIHLDHHAVDFVGQRLAVALPNFGKSRAPRPSRRISCDASSP